MQCAWLTAARHGQQCGSHVATLCARDLTAPSTSYRAWTSCNLWELSVDDVLRMRFLQPGMLVDISEHFMQTASRLLRGMNSTRL